MQPETGMKMLGLVVVRVLQEGVGRGCSGTEVPLLKWEWMKCANSADREVSTTDYAG